MGNIGLDNFLEVHLMVVRQCLVVPPDWVGSLPVDLRVGHRVGRQVDLYHLKIALKAGILVPEYLEDSQDSYLDVRGDLLGDLWVDLLDLQVWEDTLLRRMVDTGLVRNPGVHPLNCLGNRSLGILVILGVLMGNLRFVDNPVLDVGVLVGVHQGILSILEVTDIYILLGLGVVEGLEAVDCSGVPPGVHQLRRLGVDPVGHCNHDQVRRVVLLGVLKNGVQGDLLVDPPVDLEGPPVGQLKMGVLLQDSDQALQ